ncbi:MAG: AMP phosphorylase [Conexivisphaera sp.]
MKLNARVLDIEGEWSALLNHRDAKALGVGLHDRISISSGKGSISVFAELTGTMVQPGQIGIYRDIADSLGVRDGEELDVEVAPTPLSVLHIRKKLRGSSLSKDEIYSVISDVVSRRLSNLEVAGLLFAEQFVGMSLDEIESLTRAMVDTGERLELPGRVVDKHSIGGVPGNKISLLVVPIIAASGLTIPKTSSRAVTSPSGTADTMEVLANVEFTLEELRRIVTRVGGCIVWGGSLNIAPADDLIIRVEYPLRIDPLPQMVASIMAKKMAVGAKHVVLDIPVGRGTKAETTEEGERIARLFSELGKRLGIRVRAALTYGGQPVGRAVGPALEAREALSALIDPQHYISRSLIEKSVGVAGLLLEDAGVAPPGRGYEVAKEILYSGRAYSKFREILEAQGGNPNVRPEEVPVGDKVHVIEAPADGFVTYVDNDAIAETARAAGAPRDRGAGVVLRAKVGHVVRKGEALMEIYAERSTKLQEALSIVAARPPLIVEGMILEWM